MYLADLRHTKIQTLYILLRIGCVRIECCMPSALAERKDQTANTGECTGHNQ